MADYQAPTMTACPRCPFPVPYNRCPHHHVAPHLVVPIHEGVARVRQTLDATRPANHDDDEEATCR